jgi:hypothetical protein
VTLGPDFLEVVLQVFQFFGLQLAEDFLLFLLLILVQADLFLKRVFRVLDQDRF